MLATDYNPTRSQANADGPDLEQFSILIARAQLIDLPKILGRLRELEAIALTRLYTEARPTDAASHLEQLLDVEEAARRLDTTADYLYRHWKKLPFAHKYPWGLRFRSTGIDEFIRRSGMSARPNLRPKTRMLY